MILKGKSPWKDIKIYNMRMKILMILVFIFVVSCNKTDKIKSVPVKNFDVNKYLGQWYEIARTDNKFEKGCTDVTANYSLREDGGLNIKNKCIFVI